MLFPGLLPWPGAWGHLEGHPGCLPNPAPHASLCLLKPLYLKVRESAFVPLAWTKDNLWANTKPPRAGASRPLRARDGAPHSSSRTGDSHAPETPAVGPKGVPKTTRTPVRRGRGPGRPLGSRPPCSKPGKQAARPLSGAGLAPQPGGAAACPAPGKASFRSRRRLTALCECAVGRATSLRTACRGRAGALPPHPSAAWFRVTKRGDRALNRLLLTGA